MLTTEQVQAAIAAIEANDGEAMKAVLTDILASMAASDGGEPASSPSGDAAAGAGDTPANAADAAAEPNPDDEEANAVIRGLQTQVNDLLAEREARELAERRSLVARLVQLGVETPATAWSGNAEDQMPCKRLAGEPLVDLRKRVSDMAAVRGATPPTPPARVLPGVETLTAAELAACKKRGWEPAEYIARKAGAVRSVRRSEVTQ